jgi:hypothetical protein
MSTLSALRNARWTPINEPNLHELLNQAQDNMDDKQALLWKLVQLPVAEIWQQSPWADEGCGFWVVATFGKQCIYFNDLSQSFAVSHFDRWGNICVFDPRPHTLNSLLSELTKTPEIA